MNFFEFIAQEVREYLAELGFRSLDEVIGRRELLDVDRAVEHWKASGLDLTPMLVGPDFSESEPRAQRCASRTTSSTSTSTTSSSAGSRIVLEDGGTRRDRAADPQHRARRRHDARPRGHRAPRRARPAARLDRRHAHGLRRPVASAPSCRAASRCASRATRTTTSARGSRAARSCVRPSTRQRLRRRAQRDRRQRDRLRRDAGQHVHPRHRGRAVPGAQLRRDRGRRGRGRPRARVHDRRPRAHPRRDRPQPRCRHVGRHRLRARAARGPREPRVPRSGELELHPLGSADREIVRDLLEQHVAETDSARRSAPARRGRRGVSTASPRCCRATTRRCSAPARAPSTRGSTPTATWSGPGSWRSPVAERDALELRTELCSSNSGGDGWLTRRAS